MSELDQRIAAMAQSQAGAFSHAQATSAGASADMVYGRVRRGVWDRLAPRVFRIAGSPDTWHQRLWAALLETGDDAAVSHRSAAALLGIPGFTAGPVEVVRKRNRHHRIRLGHLRETFWLPPEHITLVEGVRTTTLGRCIFDIAGTEHPARVARALDNSLTRLGLQLGTLAEVCAVLGRSGKPGTTLIRELLDERGPGYVATESELEDLLNAVLARYGIEQPERQVWAGDERRVGRIDFAYPTRRVLLEADSRKHHTSLLDRDADRKRDNELMAAGWRVIRVTWDDLVQRPTEVVALIRKALAVAA